MAIHKLSLLQIFMYSMEIGSRSLPPPLLFFCVSCSCNTWHYDQYYYGRSGTIYHELVAFSNIRFEADLNCAFKHSLLPHLIRRSGNESEMLCLWFDLITDRCFFFPPTALSKSKLHPCRLVLIPAAKHATLLFVVLAQGLLLFLVL